jgi:hypothetical protein
VDPKVSGDGGRPRIGNRRRAGQDRERRGRSKPDWRWTGGKCCRPGGEHADCSSDGDAGGEPPSATANLCRHLGVSSKAHVDP